MRNSGIVTHICSQYFEWGTSVGIWATKKNMMPWSFRVSWQQSFETCENTCELDDTTYDSSATLEPVKFVYIFGHNLIPNDPCTKPKRAFWLTMWQLFSSLVRAKRSVPNSVKQRNIVKPLIFISIFYTIIIQCILYIYICVYGISILSL